MMFKKLVQKLKIEKEKSSSAAINPIDVDFDGRKHDFLSKMTKNALNLYEKQCDIKNFTKLAFYKLTKIIEIIEINRFFWVKKRVVGANIFFCQPELKN